MGSEAVEVCEVSLNNKYVVLINTYESDADVQSGSMNPLKTALVNLSMRRFEACDADQRFGVGEPRYLAAQNVTSAGSGLGRPGVRLSPMGAPLALASVLATAGFTPLMRALHSKESCLAVCVMPCLHPQQGQ